MSTHVSVVIPLCNEVENLVPMVERLGAVFAAKLPSVAYEVIFVDDGSTDGTREGLARLVAAHPRLRAIYFRRNFGKAAALAVGFKQARGEVIVTIDGDLQDPPEEIPLLLAKLDEGYDLVSGWKKSRQDPLEKRLPSKFFNWMVARAFGVPLHDFNCGFKVYRAWCVRNVMLSGSLYRFLPVFVAQQGGRIAEVPITHQRRLHGKSKYGFGRYLQGLFDIVTMVFVSKFFFKPMHFFGLVALPLLLLGGAITAGLVGMHVYWLVSGDQSFQLINRPILIFAMSLMGLGLNIILIGALSEFLLQLHGASGPSHHFYSVERVQEGGAS